MAEHNHHTEDESANNKSSIHKEDLDSSRAIDPPSNFDPIESSAEEIPLALAPEQEKYQIQWALTFTEQENAVLKLRIEEL
jgi:outer membrane cobalamin receptor